MSTIRNQLGRWVAFALALSSIVGAGCGQDALKGKFDSNGYQTGPLTIPRGTRQFKTDALIFAGDGAWAVEVRALEQILDQNRATYRTVRSRELDAMKLEEIAEFGMIVWPGGKGKRQTESLEPETRQRLRTAVQQLGVNWVGFCAGAWVAVAPPPPPGGDVEYGIGVLPGPVLKSHRFNREGYYMTMLPYTYADGSQRDLLWYGAPVTPEIPGGVIARDPDGNPGMTQAWSGNGFVVIAGMHPAAPQSTRSAYRLKDSDGLDWDVAWELLEAGLRQRELPTFPADWKKS